jgi:hypothetical protein
MSFPRTAWRCAAIVATVATLLPAGVARAAGAELSAVAGAYSANGGTIPPCEFSSAELNAALSEAGGDIQQYAGDLLNAIQRALAARASGACNSQSAAPAVTTITNVTTTPGPPPAAPVIQAPPAPPGTAAPALPAAALPDQSLTAATGSGIPAPLWILTIAGLVLTLAAGVAVVARVRGWDPLWAAAARHSWAEAGYRAAGAWEDFVDWVRMQRPSRPGTPTR